MLTLLYLQMRFIDVFRSCVSRKYQCDEVFMYLLIYIYGEYISAFIHSFVYHIMVLYCMGALGSLRDHSMCVSILPLAVAKRHSTDMMVVEAFYRRPTNVYSFMSYVSCCFCLHHVVSGKPVPPNT